MVEVVSCRPATRNQRVCAVRDVLNRSSLVVETETTTVHFEIKALQVMLRSTIINHQQHVGLQKLSGLAGITHCCLGPNKKFKFIQDEASGQSALVCSCLRIFQNLELTCAVGQLVFETIQAHHKIYHTGSGCLLFLAGAWSRAALDCLQRGISVAHIISAMSEGLDICLDVCKKCSIPIDGLGVRYSETSHCLESQLPKKPVLEAMQTSCNPQEATKVGYMTLKGSGQRKIKLSRHFYKDECKNVFTLPQPHQTKIPDIAHIAEGLSHGCDDAMNLVVEAIQIQSNHNEQVINCSTFDVTKVMTCVIPGLSENNACVFPGCIVLLSAEQASVAHHLKDQHFRVALIKGDLSNTYRHLGFKRPPGIQCVSDQSCFSSSSKAEKWIEKFEKLVLDLEVNLILVSGLVSERVLQHCCRHHILVVEKVKASVLGAFANSTGAVPVTYATQLSEHCVGSGVKVSIWRDISSHDGKPSTTVNISTGDNSELVTVVITSCVHSKLQSLEDQFWSCAYRVHHMLKDKALLPGAGATEMLCLHHLQKPVKHHFRQPSNPYRTVVLQFMADGLIDYISNVMVNTGRFSKVRARTAISQQLQDYNESLGVAAKFSQLYLQGELEHSVDLSSETPAENIYDNLSVKQEAWRKALDLVFLVLQADAEVITGIDPKTDDAQENLMLL